MAIALDLQTLGTLEVLIKIRAPTGSIDITIKDRTGSKVIVDTQEIEDSEIACCKIEFRHCHYVAKVTLVNLVLCINIADFKNS